MLGKGSLAKISLFIPSPVLGSERLKLLKTPPSSSLFFFLPPSSSLFFCLSSPSSQAYVVKNGRARVCSSSLRARKTTMSLISMMEARLPPGFRFHPRDDELVLDYLCRKLSGKGGGGGAGASYGGIAMVDVDLNKCEPWDLPGSTCQAQLCALCHISICCSRFYGPACMLRMQHRRKLVVAIIAGHSCILRKRELIKYVKGKSH
jgi:hypothetical protein